MRGREGRRDQHEVYSDRMLVSRTVLLRGIFLVLGHLSHLTLTLSQLSGSRHQVVHWYRVIRTNSLNTIYIYFLITLTTPTSHSLARYTHLSHSREQASQYSRPLSRFTRECDLDSVHTKWGRAAHASARMLLQEDIQLGEQTRQELVYRPINLWIRR